METLIYLNHMKKQSKIPTEPRMGVKPTKLQNFAARVATGNINEYDQIIPMEGLKFNENVNMTHANCFKNSQ